MLHIIFTTATYHKRRGITLNSDVISTSGYVDLICFNPIKIKTCPDELKSIITSVGIHFKNFTPERSEYTCHWLRFISDKPH
jgi:hypothetical protein